MPTNEIEANGRTFYGKAILKWMKDFFEARTMHTILFVFTAYIYIM